MARPKKFEGEPACTVSTRYSVDRRDRAQAKARREGRTLTDVIVSALDDYVAGEVTALPAGIVVPRDYIDKRLEVFAYLAREKGLDSAELFRDLRNALWSNPDAAAAVAALALIASGQPPDTRKLVMQLAGDVERKARQISTSSV